MKIQCNVCEAAEAKVLCCADEAALCHQCDQKVHAANRLATKHQRVPLANSNSPMPKCDICQETLGYFFCLEDRALLCRKCDVAIHTVNAYVSAHQRFLLTGVKVGLEPADLGSSSASGKVRSRAKTSEFESDSLAKRMAVVSSDSSGVQCNKPLSPEVSAVQELASIKLPFAGGSGSSSITQWQIDEFLALNDFCHNYSFMDNGSKGTS